MSKRFVVVVLIFLLNQNGVIKAAPSKDMVEAVMDFKISSAFSGDVIQTARIMVIDRDGHIAANALTNFGVLRTKVNLPVDPRFPIESMSTVTVIVIADGYNETIVFDVPVNEHGDGAGRAMITLRPILPDARNEPSFNAAFHRFTVFHMLDYYAEQAGLVKQRQSQGAEGFGQIDMPWSATIKKERK